MAAPDVDVAVNHAGEDEHTPGVHRLPSGIGVLPLPEDADDLPVLPLHAAGEAALRPHHHAMEYVEIIHGGPFLSPGRRG